MATWQLLNKNNCFTPYTPGILPSVRHIWWLVRDVFMQLYILSCLFADKILIFDCLNFHIVTPPLRPALTDVSSIILRDGNSSRRYFRAGGIKIDKVYSYSRMPKRTCLFFGNLNPKLHKIGVIKFLIFWEKNQFYSHFSALIWIRSWCTYFRLIFTPIYKLHRNIVFDILCMLFRVNRTSLVDAYDISGTESGLDFILGPVITLYDRSWLILMTIISCD